MTANQIAVLLAVYRGFAEAVAAEASRANFRSDVRALLHTGMIAEDFPRPWSCTPKGDAVCKFILGALSDQPMPARPF